MPFGALGLRAEGAHCRGAKGVEEVWRSVVSFPSGDHGRVPAKNGFGTFLAWKAPNYDGNKLFGVWDDR